MTILRGASLVAATLTMGLVAGLFFTFAMSVMPGLGRTGDRTFVEAMQQINVAILNIWLAISLAGAPLLTLLAAALHLTADRRSVLPWIAAALALYLVALVITIGINIPLNDALAAAGSPNQIADLAAVRGGFEQVWVRWNVVRAVAATAAFGCLTWTLVLYGRTTAA
ncbi:MAG TPA: anthrone oxygenase family protein [Pseudonocardiaceae bacterium]|jgi:uncharacterized membrane protein